MINPPPPIILTGVKAVITSDRTLTGLLIVADQGGADTEINLNNAIIARIKGSGAAQNVVVFVSLMIPLKTGDILNTTNNEECSCFFS